MSRRSIAERFDSGSGGSKAIAPDSSTPRETVTIAWLPRSSPDGVVTLTPSASYAMRETGWFKRMSRPSASASTTRT